MRVFYSLLFCSFLFAQEPSPQDFLNQFSTEKDPGSGAFLLEEKKDSIEKIELGTQSGRYGIGMVFNGKSLPEPYRKDFKEFYVIQITFGNLKNKLENKVPQFSSLTLISKKYPILSSVFQFSPASEKKKAAAGSAYILFHLPNSLVTQTDEEKLQTTYFAQEGSLNLNSLGKVLSIPISQGGRKFYFTKTRMKIALDVLLKSPFNEGAKRLKGEVEIPLYFAKGKEASQMSEKFIFESLKPPGQ